MDCSPGARPGRGVGGRRGRSARRARGRDRRARVLPGLRLAEGRARPARPRRGRDREQAQRPGLAPAGRDGQCGGRLGDSGRPAEDLALGAAGADDLLRRAAAAGPAPQRRSVSDRGGRAGLPRAPDLDRDPPRRLDRDLRCGALGARPAERRPAADPLACVLRSARLPAELRPAAHARPRLPDGRCARPRGADGRARAARARDRLPRARPGGLPRCAVMPGRLADPERLCRDGPDGDRRGPRARVRRARPGRGRVPAAAAAPRARARGAVRLRLHRALGRAELEQPRGARGAARTAAAASTA